MGCNSTKILPVCKNNTCLSPTVSIMSETLPPTFGTNNSSTPTVVQCPANDYIVGVSSTWGGVGYNYLQQLGVHCASDPVSVTWGSPALNVPSGQQSATDFCPTGFTGMQVQYNAKGGIDNYSMYCGGVAMTLRGFAGGSDPAGVYTCKTQSQIIQSLQLSTDPTKPDYLHSIEATCNYEKQCQATNPNQYINSFDAACSQWCIENPNTCVNQQLSFCELNNGANMSLQICQNFAYTNQGYGALDAIMKNNFCTGQTLANNPLCSCFVDTISDPTGTIPQQTLNLMATQPKCNPSCVKYGYQTAAIQKEGCQLSVQVQECIANMNISNYGTITGNLTASQNINCSQALADNGGIVTPAPTCPGNQLGNATYLEDGTWQCEPSPTPISEPQQIYNGVLKIANDTINTLSENYTIAVPGLLAVAVILVFIIFYPTDDSSSDKSKKKDGDKKK